MFSMKMIIIFFAFVVSINCLKCPIHCFCYIWKDMLRTDCIKRNLYNTFVLFPPETQVLDLSYNVVSILHGNEFLDANLGELKRLYLPYNRIKTIYKLSFNGLQNLEYLDLSHNFINHLDPTTFKHNLNLKTLNVSYNPLVFIRHEPLLTNTPSLQILNVAGCNIKELDEEWFSCTKEVKTLYLDGNSIEKISSKVLEPMVKLEHLDISKNNIMCTDQIKTLFSWLRNRNIQFLSFCHLSQKMKNLVTESDIAGKSIEEMDNQRTQNTTKRNSSNGRPNFYRNFFQTIPFFYVILFGMQIGILIGSCVTYCCLRMSRKKYTTSSYLDTQETNEDNGQGDSRIDMIPLRMPPGTPPSPYHSRFTLSSTFSLMS